MLLTSSLKLENHNYIVNMTLAKCADSKELRQTATIVNSNYGIKLSDTSFAFCERRFVGLTSLAMVVADSLQNGIFITDKLAINNKSDQSIWVCIFKDGKPLVNVSLEDGLHLISINGDQLLSKDELLNILPLYIQKYNPPLFSDLAFAIDDPSLLYNEVVDIKTLLKSKRNSHFKVKKIHSKNKQALAVTAIVLVSLVGYLSYSNLTQQLHKSTSTKKNIVPKISSEQKVLKLIQKNNLDGLLKSLNIITNELPIVIAGWTLHSLNYSSVDSNYITVVYDANNGQNIIDAKAEAISFLKRVSNYQDYSVTFDNNFQAMQIKIKLPTIENSNMQDLKESAIKALITSQAQVQTIADFQSNFFDYRLGNTQAIVGSYSKHDISISNINNLEFETFKSLATSHINLAITSIKALYSNGVPTWSFKGEIYV